MAPCPSLPELLRARKGLESHDLPPRGPICSASGPGRRAGAKGAACQLPAALLPPVFFSRPPGHRLGLSFLHFSNPTPTPPKHLNTRTRTHESSSPPPQREKSTSSAASWRLSPKYGLLPCTNPCPSSTCLRELIVPSLHHHASDASQKSSANFNAASPAPRHPHPHLPIQTVSCKVRSFSLPSHSVNHWQEQWVETATGPCTSHDASCYSPSAGEEAISRRRAGTSLDAEGCFVRAHRQRCLCFRVR